MSGFIEFCVELKSASEGGAAVETDGEASVSQQSASQDGSSKNGRGGRRGMLHRQNSVVCSRVHSLNTISYVDNGESNGSIGFHLSSASMPRWSLWSYFQYLSFVFFLSGKEIKRLKPKRAASFFSRQASAPTYSAVQVTESLEQG